MNCEMIRFKTAGGADGALSVFESARDVPFEIKRFYHIYGVKAGTVRGYHAHRQLCQMLFCCSGSIRIDLDDGKDKASVTLDSPDTGLIVRPGVWHTMEWLTDGAVLCAAASDYYSESDYIRDYAQFTEYINEHTEVIKER